MWDAYAGPLLEEALASLRVQDVPHRIVVVDNASRVPVAERPDVEVLRTARRLPLGAARNAGIERVTTPYVVVWDADDVMLPGTLAILEQAIVGDAHLVASATAILDELDGPRHRWPRPWALRLLATRRLFCLMHSVWSQYPATGATIMRVEDVREAGGYPPVDSGDDWVLGVSLTFRGRLGWTERPGRVYNRHGQSLWAAHSTSAHLHAHAREVRNRIRTDGAAPRWLRVSLPIVAAAQSAAIVASRVLVRRSPAAP